MVEKDCVLCVFCRNRFDILRVSLLHLYANDLSRLSLWAVDDGSEDKRVPELLEKELCAGRLQYIDLGTKNENISVRRMGVMREFLASTDATYLIQLDGDILLSPESLAEALARFDVLRARQPTVKPTMGNEPEKNLRIGSMTLLNLGQRTQVHGMFHDDQSRPWRTLWKWGEACWILWRTCLEDVGPELVNRRSGETDKWFEQMVEHTWHHALPLDLAAGVVHAGCWMSLLAGKRQTPYMAWADLEGKTPASTAHVDGVALRGKEPDWAAVYESIKMNFRVRPGEC